MRCLKRAWRVWKEFDAALSLVQKILFWISFGAPSALGGIMAAIAGAPWWLTLVVATFAATLGVILFGELRSWSIPETQPLKPDLALIFDPDRCINFDVPTTPVRQPTYAPDFDSEVTATVSHAVFNISARSYPATYICVLIRNDGKVPAHECELSLRAVHFSKFDSNDEFELWSGAIRLPWVPRESIGYRPIRISGCDEYTANVVVLADGKPIRPNIPEMEFPSRLSGHLDNPGIYRFVVALTHAEGSAIRKNLNIRWRGGRAINIGDVWLS